MWRSPQNIRHSYPIMAPWVGGWRVHRLVGWVGFGVGGGGVGGVLVRDGWAGGVVMWVGEWVVIKLLYENDDEHCL